MRKKLFVLLVGLLVGAAVGWVAYAQGSGGGGPGDEDFVPTEKLPADSAISFPVDI